MKRLHRHAWAGAVCLGLTGLLIAAGCGSKSLGERKIEQDTERVDRAISNVPDWFLEPPTDPNYVYGTGTNDSRDLQMAKSAAAGLARTQIAFDTEAKVSALFKTFMEQVGAGQDEELLRQNTQVSKIVASEIISGTRPSKQAVINEEGRFRVYVLIEMPLGDANLALRNRIRANNALYTRFLASQAFQELEADAAALEEFKKEQTPGTIPTP